MRAWLFVPGHEEAKLKKALARAKVVVIDWEDAVPNEAKCLARELTLRALEKPLETRVLVRVNPLGTTDGAEDQEWLAAHPDLFLGGVMVAKAEDPEALASLGETLPFPLVPLVETAHGLVRAYELARAHPRVERLALGYLDLLADLGARWSPEGGVLDWARCQLVLASRAAGRKSPLDGVYPLLNNPEGLKAEARRARDLGFFGKLVVHPDHVALVEEVFSSETAETADLFRTMAQALEEAKRQGKVTARLPDGRFVDPAVLAWAKKLAEGGER